ncbi:hypothetical protein LC55x_2348 [Lysobacter capsici]|nr:hypothetical protein LC55x_2348 [Lysobacter capsici]
MIFMGVGVPRDRACFARHSRERGNPVTLAGTFLAWFRPDFERSRAKGPGFPRSRE